MIPEPLPYSPEIEVVPDDEADTIRGIIDSMRREAEIVARSRGGHAVRASHAKSTGAVVGMLRIAPDLPPELAQGLFARPGTYDVAVRFAQGPGEHLPDSVSTHRGMAIKVTDVPGARIDGHDVPVQDFVLATGTTFPSGTAKGFLKDSRQITAATPLPDSAKGAVSALARGVERAAEAIGTEVPRADFFGHPFLHPLAEPYFSQAPMRWGDFVAKLGAFPVGAHQTAMRDARIDASDDPDAFRQVLESTMARVGATFELRAQLWTDAASQPIEDASVEWSADAAPFRKVGTIELPAQPGHDAARARFFDESLVFRPAHSLEAHRPLGSVMRARLEVYRALSKWRHEMNDETERNPDRLDAIPEPAGVPSAAPPPAYQVDRPVRREARRDDRARLGGIGTKTALLLGLSALAAGVVVYAGAQRRHENRPPDDADARLREDGDWRGRHAVAGKAVLIGKPRAEIYAFWRDLSNQSKFMENVEAIRTDGTRSTWTLAGLAGQEVEVEVDLIEDRTDERLAWASVPGSQIETRGHVEFRDAPAGRGTYVELVMEYVPPAGALGRTVATLFRRSPQVQARHGLKRLKMLLETGEIATSARTRSEKKEIA